MELLLGGPLDTVKPTDYQSDFRLHRRARRQPSPNVRSMAARAQWIRSFEESRGKVVQATPPS